MNRVEAIITLTNTASLLRDGTRYMKPEHEKQFREAFEMAIKALEQAQPESKNGKRIETLDISTERNWKIIKVVDISSDSIEAIADAVVRKLRGEQDE